MTSTKYIGRDVRKERISIAVRYIFDSLHTVRGASMYDESEKPHALVCTEVWGGNRKVIPR